jgi:hypothetical protein
VFLFQGVRRAIKCQQTSLCQQRACCSKRPAQQNLIVSPKTFTLKSLLCITSLLIINKVYCYQQSSHLESKFSLLCRLWHKQTQIQLISFFLLIRLTVNCSTSVVMNSILCSVQLVIQRELWLVVAMVRYSPSRWTADSHSYVNFRAGV